MKPFAGCAIVMLLISLFGISCKSKHEKWEQEQINQFGEKLAKILLSDSAESYIELWPNEGDRLIDVSSQRVASVPLRNELPSPSVMEVKHAFNRCIDMIRVGLGGSSDIQLVEIEYLIDRSPAAKQYGLFQFTITITLQRGGRRVSVRQGSCVLGVRGVLVGDILQVRA